MNPDGTSKLLLNPLMKLEGVAKDASKPSSESGNPKVETQKEVPKAEEPKVEKKEGGGPSTTNKEEGPATADAAKDRAVMRKGKWTVSLYILRKRHLGPYEDMLGSRVLLADARTISAVSMSKFCSLPTSACSNALSLFVGCSLGSLRRRSILHGSSTTLTWAS